MKFKELKDAHLFLFEIGRTDLIESVKSTDWDPPKELLQEYIKARRALVPQLKDFRKSQTSKENWRKNRFKMKRGIKAFHRSTEGKKFHRSLGRYLATRISKSGRYGNYDEKYEALKGLSSLRTHIYIDNGYFKPLEEQIDFEFFMDEIIPVTLSEELKTYKDDDISSEEDLDILCRAVTLEDLLKEYCSVIGKDYTEELLQKFTDGLLSEDQSYVELLRQIVGELS